MNNSEFQAVIAVSNAIISVRHKDDLVRVIFEQIQRLLPFDDAGIAILNEAGDQYREFLTDQTVPSEVNQQFSARGYFNCWLPVDDTIGRAFDAQEPILIDVVDEARRYPDTTYLPVFEAAGIRQVIARQLVVRGVCIGEINFNSRQANQYSESDFPLFNAIADQIAVAVANILANEEILERELEKTVLLEVSQAIATIYDKRQLLTFIIDQVRPLFGFDDVGLGILEPDGLYINDWAVQYADILPPDIASKQVTTQRYPFVNSLLDHAVRNVTNAGRPLVYKLTPELANQWPDASTYLANEMADRQQETLFTTLRTGGQLLGTFNINSKQSGRFEQTNHRIFQAIADQIAVAVANILANEEILEREQEKSLQLAVTTTLTSAAPWIDKWQRVVDEIGTVVPWDMVSIIVLQRPALSMRWRRNEDGTACYVSLEQHSRELNSSPAELFNLIIEFLAANTQSVVYCGDDFEQLRQQHELVDLTYRRWHIRSQVNVFIPVNDSPPVVLMVHSRQPYAYTNAQLGLLQRLVPVMTLALENIFSFEALAQREGEKTRQLALNKVLVSSKDSRTLYGAMAEELNELVTFDTMSVRVVSEQRLRCYVVIRKIDGVFTDVTRQLNASHPALEQLELEQAGIPEQEPAIYTGETFALQCADRPLYRLRQQLHGVRSTIELPLPMKEGQPAVLMLGSRAAYAFTGDDLTRLSLFVPQVALALENLLSFEEIKALKKSLEQEKSYLVEEIKITHNFEEIIGTSPLLTDVFRQVGQVAPTDASVLITGESGTGKELIARAIHNRSRRKDKVFVKINCAALPASLIESELFGHEKGAFTGALDKRVGKFELANGGTIFLDEIGEMPLELQAKLLRVLQEREYERLGSNNLHKTDVRVIAATNRNLSREVAEGRFRLDLFYRLRVFPVHMPSLRERVEDVPLLAHYFARKYFRKVGKPFRGIQETTMLALMTYSWPGNVRELENAMEQAAILTDGTGLLTWSPAVNQTPVEITVAEPVLAYPSATAIDSATQTVGAIRKASAILERERILTVLKQTGGRIRGESGAARVLGLKPTTLEARIARLGIRRDYKTC